MINESHQYEHADGLAQDFQGSSQMHTSGVHAFIEHSMFILCLFQGLILMLLA